MQGLKRKYRFLLKNAIAFIATVSFIATLAWIYIARNSRYFIGGTPGSTQYVEVGDVVDIAGPIVEYPDGDMYLFLRDMHAFPWLFRWSTEQTDGSRTQAAEIDRGGSLHALAPGIANAYAHPLGGRGFGYAKFVITPRVDAVVVRLSSSSIEVGDTLKVEYTVIQAGGTPMRWWPVIPTSGDGWELQFMKQIEGGQFLFLARRSGTVTISVDLGRHIARESLVIH
jgi:hypothetical protein